jgi:RNA polymerase sigma-70 factor (ECF subfamily)
VALAHADDVALAAACAAGDEAAWERFVREYRPVLYRAADALDTTGRARELADALYADLYGLIERDGERRSLLRYYQGRSSLATWLRAVLAQRYVDLLRAARRLDPLPDDESAAPASASAPGAPAAPPDPDRARNTTRFERAFAESLSGLDSRDRLRLGLYYTQELTLAQAGRMLRESEATVSRQLARTRRAIRDAVERRLRTEGLGDAEIAECFESATADPGQIDLNRVLGDARKEPAPRRSILRRLP